MGVRERILAIRIMEINKTHSDFLNEIGVQVKPENNDNDSEIKKEIKNEKQYEKSRTS